MSSTRRASDNSVFRQERFASAPEFERGLMANLVAKRCAILERRDDRQLIWFLQMLSHQDGGIKKLATDLIEKFPEQVATRTMQNFGVKPTQIYSANQIKVLREEFGIEPCDMPLYSEVTEYAVTGYLMDLQLTRQDAEANGPTRTRLNFLKRSKASEFQKFCINLRDLAWKTTTELAQPGVGQ